MEVNLSEEQLGEAVTKAIVNSVVGEKLTAAIEKSVKEAIDGNYRNTGVVDQVVRQVIRDSVTQIVAERSAEIKAAVAEKLTGEQLEKFVTKMWDGAMRDL